MKKNIKIILIIIVLLTIPIKVKANNINNLKVYDHENILTTAQEKTLNNKILIFSKKSNIEIIIITLDEANDNTALRKANNFYEQNEFKENGLALIMNKHTQTSQLLTKGELSYTTKPSVLKFKQAIIENSNIEGYYSYDDTIKFIEDCNNYYNNKLIKILISIALLSLLITKIIIFLIKKRYTIKSLENAVDYYNIKNIKYITKEQ